MQISVPKAKFEATSKLLDPGSTTQEIKQVQLVARVPADLHSRFYAACSARGLTGSAVIRALMQDFIQAASHTRVS